MTRPGHHRPLGTTTTMRFPDWLPGWRAPALGDIACQTVTDGSDPDELERAYRVVGVEETRTGYRLVMERVAYETLPDSLDPEAIWTFYNMPRSR